jgi:flavin reductase (DIM6/NTAB) family NADH-FMN oxidoreductase RutF
MVPFICDKDRTGLAMQLTTRRNTLRLLSKGMYLMTSRSGDRYSAATVTWLSQASFTPPMIMAAIRKDSSVFKCMSCSGRAAIHILASNQQDLAQRFLSPANAGDSCINGELFTAGVTGVPILPVAQAHVECRVVRMLADVGDHAVVIFEVVEAECRDALMEPLTVSESPWHCGG